MLPIESLGLSANQWKFLSMPPNRYIAESIKLGRPLVYESTKRQFATAKDILERLNGSCGESARRGVLLADDVGLGKTTVAALVAWVVASAGERSGVRILAPNDVMMRRWEEELLAHIGPLQACAPALDVRPNRVKARKLNRLSAGTIQVVKHSYASSSNNLACDLLIVDEAHRAKGDSTAFSNALKKQKKFARRVLILTATPFSIQLEELTRMLTLVGGESAHKPIREFKRLLDNLYSGNISQSPEIVAASLAAGARNVVEALRYFVIRHGIDDLPRELDAFGKRKDWSIEVKPASPVELELLIRMDRALRLASHGDSESSRATNDPRFHVGWQHFDVVRKKLQSEAARISLPDCFVVKQQLKHINDLRKNLKEHSKMAAVAKSIQDVIQQGEKVLLFCHHHATAQELTTYLASTLPVAVSAAQPSVKIWRRTWDQVLKPPSDERLEAILRDTFIQWLCSELIRKQTWNWILASSASTGALKHALECIIARHPSGNETIALAAQRLFSGLLKSRSSRAVLEAAIDRPELLPGANGTSRVLGICTPSVVESEELLFLHNRQPDTVISIFNSPFGPDVLVVTDKLSEGVDLHRYCRYLVHYELDPSPIRTVQRNGRLRRVNSWAAVTKQPISYAYPAFRGTRDHRLVQIMKKRIDSFSLLLGGVQDFDVDEIVDSEEIWRNDTIAKAKFRLASVSGKLLARRSK